MKRMSFIAGILLVCTVVFSVSAQQARITGQVKDKDTQLSIPGAAIRVGGNPQGYITDENGKFTFEASKGNMTVNLTISHLGYQSVELLAEPGMNIQIELSQAAILGQEVVISASRTPERLLSSPVSIERISGKKITETPGLSFYDALANLKGVEMSTQSLTFKSVNTRGFNSDGNFRFNQFVDGMDNMAPGLTFPVGNMVGISDLDLESAELLPGAASALYGAGGTNGTLVMSSKSPLKYEGVSFQLRQGVNHLGNSKISAQPLFGADIRLAKAWNNKFGIKTSVSFLKAKDWLAANRNNYDRVGNKIKGPDNEADPNYDGVNVYGDELSRNMRNVAQAVVAAGQQEFIRQYGIATGGLTPSQQEINQFLQTNAQTAPFFIGLNTPGLIPNESIARTGYNEMDLADYNAGSLKTSTAAHYRFKGMEAIAQVNWGRGTTMYTGSDRYSLRNFSIGQYKLELKGDAFFVRGYTTRERSGDSYVTSVLGSYINEQSKPSQVWFPEYIANFVGAKSKPGISDQQAHSIARSAANANRFQPGTPAFEQAKDQVLANTISSGNGAKFDDRTTLDHYEGMYNFNKMLNGLFELQAGGSYRTYRLRSKGTIFDDLGRKLNISEMGAYAILGKAFLEERLKVTFAARVDKHENFQTRFSPRLTGVYRLAENHYIRASYQSGYRNPTTQYQYMDLAAGGGAVRLIGGLPEMLDKYDLYGNKPYSSASYQQYLNSLATGKPDQSLLKQVDLNPKGVTAETVQAFELGDKVLISPNLLVDAYVYVNAYRNFMSEIEVYQINGQDVTAYSLPTNITGRVKAYGAAIGVDYQLANFDVTGNLSYNDIANLPAGYADDYGFNTPTFRFNIGFANQNLYKNIGFNAVFRWQNGFDWSTPFTAGRVSAYGSVDGQLNWKIPSLKSMVKIGGSNLLNNYYNSSYGNPSVGGIYYVAVSYNL